MRAKAVDLPWADARQVAVEDSVGALGQIDPAQLVGAGAVEETELDPARVGREDREVDPARVGRGP